MAETKVAETSGVSIDTVVTGEAEGETRYQRGLRRLRELDGQDGVDWAQDVRAISPDFERYIVENAFGVVWSRNGLTDREREIATIAALTAMANVKAELVSHIAQAEKIGLTRDEILEIILHMTVYAGFPAALEALDAAREVFSRPEGFAR